MLPRQTALAAAEARGLTLPFSIKTGCRMSSQALPEAAFQRIMKRLAPEQIRSFPEHLIPQSIDPEWVARLPDPARRAAIEELMWSRMTAGAEASKRARAQLDPEAYQALEALDSASTAGADRLERRTEDLLEQCARAAATRGAQPLDTSALNATRELARDLGQIYGRLCRNRLYLDTVRVEDPQLQTAIRNARSHAASVLDRLEQALGRFHLLEMDLAISDMERYLHECETSATRLQVIDEQIAELRSKLERESRWLRRLLRPQVARHQRQAIRQRIANLHNELRQIEVPISEERLCGWLDVLTESSLLADFGDWQNKAQQMRPMLYRLLNTYCQQQEGSARRMARQQMSARHAREAVDYYISSERFILDYFTRKRQEITLWLSGAAREKLDTLDRIRDEILRDFRGQSSPASNDQAAA